jgi:DNA-binding HxlR family transcriptional regulator
MEHKSFAGMNCSIARALEEVGERWTLLIVRECVLGTTRFEEFQRRLGIARNILTTRLGRLIELGVLERCQLPDEGRMEYRLTSKGEELLPVLIALLQWGDRWVCAEGGPPVRYVDATTRKAIPRLGTRPGSNSVLRPQDVRIEPGPGASPATEELLARRRLALGH